MAKSYKQKLKPRLFPADPLMMMFGRLSQYRICKNGSQSYKTDIHW